VNKTTVNKKIELNLFVPSDLDDYGLDPYEFRIYSRIARRGGINGESWESISHMARGCCMSVRRAREAVHLLEAAGLVDNIERPGQTTIRRITPRSKWVSLECLSELRKQIASYKSPKTSKNVQGVLAQDTPLPLAQKIDEGIPIEGILTEGYPTPLIPQNELINAGVERKDEGYSLSKQLAQLVQSTLAPVFSSFVQETRVLLSEVLQSSMSKVSSLQTKQVVQPKNKKSIGSSSCCISSQFLHLEELARLTNESVDSLHFNANLIAALAQYPDNVEDAWVYFKQAWVTWSSKPGLGLFISAVKKGSKPSVTKPGGGWKEWADEATHRRLMSYSQSKNGDIAIYFNNGVQRLWSEVRSLSWSEIEQIASEQLLLR